MNTPNKRVETIFEAVRKLASEGERAAYLTKTCGDDAELRGRVEALLKAHGEAGSFLALSTHAPAADNAGHVVADSAGDAHAPQTNRSTISRTITEGPGTRIGPYKLLQQIGEGGFGVVFMAEQERPVRRRVALKIIKLGMDTKQVVARFEQERQALALMDHPNIAKVFDAGATDSGSPYFVMEYVKGDPITTFADAHKLNVRERLHLFMQVCQAVQHAHTKGVIHRDIKPRNVLANMTDGRPFAKVIDFGIAKATGSNLTDKTLFTEHHQLIGTPEYMSPEQAEGSPDIDTGTDVYALGVLLYELLTGATPFDAKRLRSAAFGEMQRIIKEEEPPAPSMRLTRDLATLAATAAARQVGVDRLGTLIKGELDWIAMKALDKDRARRYESPNQLAADVQRHLSGEPVVAAPPSVGYRLRKFVRKHRAAVVSGSAVAAALILGIAGTTWQWNNANRANARLRAQSATAREGVGRMMSILSDGAVGGQVDSHNNVGRSESEADPLGFAVGFGIQLAKFLKDERDRLLAANAAFIREREALVQSYIKVLEGSGFYSFIRLDDDGVIRFQHSETGEDGFMTLGIHGGDWRAVPLNFSIPLMIEEELSGVVARLRDTNAQLCEEVKRAQLAEAKLTFQLQRRSEDDYSRPAPSIAELEGAFRKAVDSEGEYSSLTNLFRFEYARKRFIETEGDESLELLRNAIERQERLSNSPTVTLLRMHTFTSLAHAWKGELDVAESINAKICEYLPHIEPDVDDPGTVFYNIPGWELVFTPEREKQNGTLHREHCTTGTGAALREKTANWLSFTARFGLPLGSFDPAGIRNPFTTEHYAELATRAVVMDPDSAYVHCTLAIAAYRMTQYVEALTSARVSTERYAEAGERHNRDNHFNLAITAMAQWQLDRRD